MPESAVAFSEKRLNHYKQLVVPSQISSLNQGTTKKRYRFPETVKKSEFTSTAGVFLMAYLADLSVRKAQMRSLAS